MTGFPPPLDRQYMVYRCRGHWHLGAVVWAEEYQEWDYLEMGTVESLGAAWLKWRQELEGKR